MGPEKKKACHSFSERAAVLGGKKGREIKGKMTTTGLTPKVKESHPSFFRWNQHRKSRRAKKKRASPIYLEKSRKRIQRRPGMGSPGASSLEKVRGKENLVSVSREDECERGPI